MASPIKCELLYNKYIKKEIEEDDPQNRKIKFRYESETTIEQAEKEINDIFSSPLLNAENNVKVYCKELISIIPKNIQYTLSSKIVNNDKIKDIEKYDSLCSLIVFISKIFQQYKFY